MTHPDYNFETTQVDSKIYNVELLQDAASKIGAIEVPLENLRYAVDKGHYYWTDRNGNKLGPYQI